ncbi:MAG: hypothetical protein PWQ75_817 [Methanolobus sp.]|jgi:HEAT repeat protein|uniref:HEAT repeat domain-containing protein n=1 Tax=Methanolobus sp. TaxID=1874737 RepID=UPI002585BE8F|nr:HEAT repeat domain-containing protein [Methanolobus sp.]MDK2831065.1 hypothetical protein [Methanolobus sp.]
MSDTSGKNKEFISSVKKLQKGIFSNANKRCDAVKSLENQGDSDAVPYLLEAVEKETDEQVSTCIIQSLGVFGDSRATETLFELVFNSKYKSSDNQKTIISSLDSCVNGKNLPFLIEMLSSGSINRKKFSVQCIGKIKTADSIRVLVRCLNDNDKEIRALATSSLKLFKAESMIPCIAEIIENADRYYKIRLLSLVGDTGSPFAVPLLLQVLKSSDVDVRSSATKALNSCIKKESAPYLIDSLKDENFNVKCVAIKELLALKVEIPSATLNELLNDENEHVRSSAVEALVTIGNDESLSILEKVGQEDPDEWVRKLAMNHVLRISNEVMMVEVASQGEELVETANDNLSGHKSNKPGRKRKLSFCPYCGNSLEMAVSPQFCPFCGEKLKS